jgi:hypothetical protein
MTKVYGCICQIVKLDILKLYRLDFYRYVFSDMLHQEYTLSYSQNIHSNRSKQ